GVGRVPGAGQGPARRPARLAGPGHPRLSGRGGRHLGVPGVRAQRPLSGRAPGGAAPPGASATVDPVPRLVRDRLTWLSYGQVAAFGYFFYGFGPVVPLLREEQHTRPG